MVLLSLVIYESRHAIEGKKFRSGTHHDYSIGQSGTCADEVGLTGRSPFLEGPVGPDRAGRLSGGECKELGRDPGIGAGRGAALPTTYRPGSPIRQRESA